MTVFWIVLIVSLIEKLFLSQCFLTEGHFFQSSLSSLSKAINGILMKMDDIAPEPAERRTRSR